jgi:hypothetical protein
MQYKILESFGTVNVLLRADGKFGVADSATGEIAFRYRTLDGAREIAAAFAAENAVNTAPNAALNQCSTTSTAQPADSSTRGSAWLDKH